MKHVFALTVSILTSAWLAAGAVIYGNFTPTDSPVSVVPHVEPNIDGAITWTATTEFQRLCAAPAVGSTVRSGLEIHKADCNVVIDTLLANNGYWTLQGFTSCETDCALLGAHGTCVICGGRPGGDERTQYSHVPPF